jgi:hypothetical protein
MADDVGNDEETENEKKINKDGQKADDNNKSKTIDDNNESQTIDENRK